MTKLEIEAFLAEKRWLPLLPENVEVTITIDTVINPTEDRELVLNAARIILVNITDFPSKLSGDNARSVLEGINQRIEQQHIMDAARRHIMENLTFDAGTTVIFINKQVALRGRLNFSEEAPLGPIIILIHSNRIDQVINHYFPKAEWKYPKKRKKKYYKREKVVKHGEIVEEIEIEDIDPQELELEDDKEL